MTAEVFICSKIHTNFIISLEQLALEEEQVMNQHFKREQPLLTKEKDIEIRSHFVSDEFIAIDRIYQLLFESDSSLGYSMEFFIEDLQDFILLRNGFMNVDEVLRFISDKQ